MIKCCLPPRDICWEIDPQGHDMGANWTFKDVNSAGGL